MPNDPQQALSNIIADHGRLVATSPQRLEAFLKDYLPGAPKGVIHSIVAAAREGIPVELLDARGTIPVEVLHAQLQSRLEENLQLTPEAASQAVRYWAIALGQSPSGLPEPRPPLSDIVSTSSQDTVNAQAAVSTSLVPPVAPALPPPRPAEPFRMARKLTVAFGAVAITGVLIALLGGWHGQRPAAPAASSASGSAASPTNAAMNASPPKTASALPAAATSTKLVERPGPEAIADGKRPRTVGESTPTVASDLEDGRSGSAPAYVAQLAEANHKLKSENWIAASEIYSAIVQQQAPPEIAGPASLGLGRCCLGQRRFAEAVKNLKIALDSGFQPAEAHLLRGQAHEALKELEPALADYRKTVELLATSNTAEDVRLRGIARFRLADRGQGMFPEAHTDLGKAVDIEPDFALNYIERGRFLLFRLHFGQAREDAARAESLDANSAEAAALAGEVALHMRNFDGAKDKFERAASLAPQNPAYLVQLAEVYNRLRNFDLALRNVTAAQAIDSAYAPACFVAGQVHESQGRFREAETEYSKALGYEPKNVRWLRVRAKCLEELNESAQSLKLVGKARAILASIAAKSAAEFFEDAAIHEDASDRPNCAAVCDAAIQINSRLAWAHDLRGMVLRVDKKFEDAMVEADRAVNLDPFNTVYLWNRLLIRTQVNDHRAMVGDLTILLQLEPDNANWYHHRGDVYRALQDYTHAIEDYNAAIRLRPGAPDYANGRGHVYADKGDYEAAVRDYTVAIRLAPTDPMYYIYRAEAYMKKKEFALATSDYTQAIELRRHDISFYELRSQAYRAQGLDAQADADRDKITELESAN